MIIKQFKIKILDMKPYVIEDGRRIGEFMKLNKSKNYKKGKFNTSRNRVKKALKTRVRQQLKRIELDE